MTDSDHNVETILAESVSCLDPMHRDAFETIRVPLHKVPVASDPGEFVVVVAQHNGRVLYWSDIEEGWDLSPLTTDGAIQHRGANQYELSHVMHQIFGGVGHP